MSIIKEIGGQRVGSSNKMTVRLRNYERSSHNLSRIFRSSMAPGTLVPFIVEVGLPGDTFDIDMREMIKTLPTNGPLFGSFKFQAEMYVAPMRLYNRQLHNNKLNIGRDMSKVIFPQVELRGPSKMSTKAIEAGEDPNTRQINPSSLIAYLGVRGLGYNAEGKDTVQRNVNAMPLLAYWEIFKNYYANKQEERAFYIAPSVQIGTISQFKQILSENASRGLNKTNEWPNERELWYFRVTEYTSEVGEYEVNADFDIRNIQVGLAAEHNGEIGWRDNLSDYEPGITIESDPGTGKQKFVINNPISTGTYYITYRPAEEARGGSKIQLKDFLLTNIDDKREEILGHENTSPLILLGDSEDGAGAPDNGHFKRPYIGVNKQLINYDGYYLSEGHSSSYLPMAGLAVKTYLSDRFNNWLSTEWIDGENGISEITKIDVSDGLKIDTLNLMEKVYDMLNRIAVSGGSYNDWQEAVYGETSRRIAESPIYMGGMASDIIFNEVISTAETDNQPLGELGGRGQSQHRSNRIRIKIEEPSYIIGICSITPRIDYSQGNKWFNRLETMNDLHKPQLDGIGFQELITDEITAWETEVDNTGLIPVEKYFSAGKQPAWIHYMTAVNETFGTFAERNNAMFMTLNRNYSWEETENRFSTKDLTTYIDPSKYNYAFADADLTAQNFWVQIALDITARRKMSAKIIPNL